MLCTHGNLPRYHCILTLLSPVSVTSALDGESNKTKALPIFSFSYKANPPLNMGTSKRYTLQFLKDVSYEKLHALDQGLAFRGGVSEDPCLCSLLLHALPQKFLQEEHPHLSHDTIYPIFESRDLIAKDPQNRRLFKEELYLVLRTSPPQLTNIIPLPLLSDNNRILSLSLSGWTGLLGLSTDKFDSSPTADTSLMQPYSSTTHDCSSEDTLVTALTSAQNSGIDLTSAKLAYISWSYLQIPSCTTKTDSLVIIYEKNNETITAGWSILDQPRPTIRDIPNMEKIRRLYSFEARVSLPPGLKNPARPSTVKTPHDKLAAALQRQRDFTLTKHSELERRIANIENILGTATTPPVVPLKKKKNKKKKPTVE